MQGTRLFQSISVLASGYSRPGKRRHHDYLDDLESFFNVLVYLFLVYRPDGSRLPSDDESAAMVLQWDTPGPAASAGLKACVQMPCAGNGVRAPQLVEASWGSICADLFKQFRDWIFAVRHEKEDLLQSSKVTTESALSSLLSMCKEHYSAVLKMFDDAVMVLALRETEPIPTSASSSSHAQSPISALPLASEADPSPPAVAPLPSGASPNVAERTLKRRSEEAESPDANRAKSRCIDNGSPTPRPRR